jgi:hypothetical protein
MGTQAISRVFLYIWNMGITWHLFTKAWSTIVKEYLQLGMVSSAVSHQGLALSQQLSHQIGTHDA